MFLLLESEMLFIIHKYINFVDNNPQKKPELTAPAYKLRLSSYIQSLSFPPAGELKGAFYNTV